MTVFMGGFFTGIAFCFLALFCFGACFLSAEQDKRDREWRKAQRESQQ